MKPLTLEETTLKEEMKERCLAKGQYVDENAKKKFDMLCHLEDFEIKYWELQQENKHLDEVNCKLRKTNEQLKDNWNMLKEHLKNRYDNGTESISYRQVFMEIREAMQVLEIAQELEGSDSNE